jgi:hypothetical protein
MKTKVVFWLEPNQSLVPVDQIPGAIAEARYPLPNRDEAAGEAVNDPDAVNRLTEERAQAKRLRMKYPNLPEAASFSIVELMNYLDGLGLKASFMASQPDEIDSTAAISDITQTPEQQAEQRIAWYDVTLNASLWMARKNISPHDAAMLLCRLDPLDSDSDPLLISTDKTTPDDFKRLLLVFNDEGGDGRPLVDWLEIAKDSGLKFHSWITDYLSAKTLTSQDACQSTPTGPHVSKQDLINGLMLTEPKWDDILKRPERDGKRYLPALVSKGRRGKAPAGGSNSSLWNPILFISLAVEHGDLNQAQAVARFKKAWPQWQDELTAEMG